MEDRWFKGIVVVLLVVLVAVQVGLAFRPPQRALFNDFAQVLGQKEAEILILRSVNQRLQQQVDAVKAPAK